MDSVNNNRNVNSLYWEEESKVPENNNDKLTQEDFFSLLTEQLAMQDPTKPVDNDQMIAQMTSFTMADSLAQLNSKFDTFAESMNSNQALQASSLIGQSVLVPGNSAMMYEEGGGVSGTIIAEESVKDLQITVVNERGETVRVMPVGNQDAGNIAFGWDGTDQNGNKLPAGNYTIQANGEIDGEKTDIPTAVHRHVQSVSLASSSQGIILNLYGDESIKLDSVLEVGG